MKVKLEGVDSACIEGVKIEEGGKLNYNIVLHIDSFGLTTAPQSNFNKQLAKLFSPEIKTDFVSSKIGEPLYELNAKLYIGLSPSNNLVGDAKQKYRFTVYIENEAHAFNSDNFDDCVNFLKDEYVKLKSDNLTV